MSATSSLVSSPGIKINDYLWAFIAVFWLRYIRVISNIYGNIIYKPTSVAPKPTHDASNTSVIIFTINLDTKLLYKVAESVLLHPIAKLIIVSNGAEFKNECTAFQHAVSDARVQLLHCAHKGRRQKTALAIFNVQTPFVVLQDDKSIWPVSSLFAPIMLAPFEDPRMGAVMPLIEARHHRHQSITEAFYKFLGMTYLTRRNHEYRACNAIDGGLSTLTGRFGLFRTSIYANKRFQHEYLNEYCWLPFFGKRGPLDADDDKFHTRWLIEHGWKMKIQSCPETTLVTENGESNRFASQVLRWTRTTWRSNPRELMHVKVWRQHPFTAVTLALWMLRMSMLHELLMFWLLYKTCERSQTLECFHVWAATLALWIMALKLNKIWPHFAKYPKDLIWFVPYLLFGWVCSFAKLWALFTLHKTEWVVAERRPVGNEEKDEHISHDHQR